MKTLYSKSNALWSCCLVAMAMLCAVPTMAQTTFPFSASPALTIPDDGYNGSLASMGASNIAVTGVTGSSVINIEVDVNLNHTWVGDLIMKLQSPDGSLLTLVSRPGSAETVDDGTTGTVGTNSDWLGSTLTFTDLGTTDAELLNTPFTGTYFPNPGASTSPTQTFASLFGGSMNGNWTLYVGDRAADDIGTLNSWAIRITTINPAITVFKTVAVEDGNLDCSDDAEPLLSASTLSVGSATYVCYFYTAFNDGDVALGLHDISDDVLGNVATGVVFDLLPTEGVYVSYGPILVDATVTNVGTWTAYNAGPVDVATNTASATVTFTGPPNIICEDAVSVSCGSVTAGTTIGSTEDILALPTYNGGSKGAGVWYTFTGNGQDVTFSTCTNTDFDSEINVYTGDCLDIFLVDGNDDVCGVGSSVTVPTVNGDSYFIYVSDYITGGIGGNFELTVACTPPVVGCNNATADGQFPGSSITPDAGGAVTTIATNQYAGSEYSVITSIQSGSDYEFTHANGAYITVRQGAVTGPIVGAGYSPLTITAGSAADLYVHWTLDHLCTVDGSGLYLTTVQLIVVPPCDADAGTLVANASEVCLVGGSATVSATVGNAPVVPAGYSVAYVLTQGTGLDIVSLSPTPPISFNVTTAGFYTLHTIVYDPADQAALLASTTAYQADALLIQGGGSLCGSLDMIGAPVQVGACDCNGDVDGTAFVDDCSICVGGQTGLVACVADCNGDFGGTAITDECDNCVGGNTGLTACVQDCEGNWGGPAFIDNCSDCVGGGTGLVACVADCNGDFGGTAAIDECSVCAGGNTGIEPCVPVGVNNADALANALHVFPNPSNGQFIIELNGVDGKATMNIVDMMGRNVYTQAIILNGTFRKAIALNVAKGTYVMQVVTTNGIATRKVEVN